LNIFIYLVRYLNKI